MKNFSICTMLLFIMTIVSCTKEADELLAVNDSQKKAGTSFVETEDNNYKSSADGPFLGDCVLTGSLSDDVDWFKISPTITGNIFTIRLNSNSYYFSAYIYREDSLIDQIFKGETIEINESEQVNYYLKIESVVTGITYSFSINYYINQETEPNSTMLTANGGLYDNLTVTGDFTTGDYKDWFYFDVYETGVYELLYYDDIYASSFDVYYDGVKIGDSSPNRSWEDSLSPGRYYIDCGGYCTNYELTLNPNADKYQSYKYIIDDDDLIDGEGLGCGWIVDNLIYCEDSPGSNYYLVPVRDDFEYFDSEVYVWYTDSDQNFYIQGVDVKGNPIITYCVPTNSIE